MSDRLKRFLPLVVFAVIAAVFLSLQQRMQSGDYDPSALPSALLDKPLPDAVLPVLDNEENTVSIASLKGEPFLLNVWATWCVSCRAEHEYLNRLAGSGITVIGLNYKDSREEANKWLQNLGNPYRQALFDEDGAYGLELGVYGAPETYIVDAGGIVRYRHVGVMNQRAWDRKILPLGIDW